MLKLSTKIALMPILALASASLCAPLQPPSEREGCQSKSDTKQANKSSAKQNAGTDDAPLVVKVLPPQDSATKTAQDAKDRKDRTDVEATKTELDKKLVEFNGELAYYTKALAWVAALQFVALIAQAIFLRLALRASERTAERQLRAYVHVSAAQFDLYSAGHFTCVGLHFKNYGQTPAYKVTHHGTLIIGGRSIETKKYSLGIIGPSGHTGARMSDDLPYDDRVHSTLCDETISLYVSGRVVYVDCSGEERVTEYKLCARDFNIAPIFHFSDDGNEAT